MRFRRFIPCVTTILAVGAGVGGFYHRKVENASDAFVPAVAIDAGRSAKPSAQDETMRVGESPAWRARHVSAMSVLPGEEAALTAEAVALQMLAHDTDLQLGADQWMVLAAVTQNIQAIRHAYEASIAVASVIEPGRGRIEIPVYAAAGDALRAKFHAELRAQLGEANATEVIGRLGARLEGHFAGFGVSVQTLDIAGDPRIANDDLEVTRTVKYWNSVEGQDRLTIRRETHFPGREDPAGENWGSLLSVLATRIAERTGS